ncbi:MAG: SusC/RagA family TonB-linked outer membrane protein [Bacteroides sp.]|nr:SusC/RagA family TonB-linked outer membrane protein [Bacteroides sp.]
MKKHRLLTWFTLLLTGVVNIYAQQHSVTGKVLDGNNEPLIGVSVMLKETSQGTITDFEGTFSIEASAGQTLTVSYIGYITQDIVIRNQSSLTVIMKEDNKLLDEVVVVGYGSMKKKDLTGAVSSIDSKKLEKEAPRNLQDILRTGVPGLNVGMDNSAKGGGSIQIRGQRSLKAGNTPLIVLDGIIFTGELSEINPLDIDRVDVLKDASSAAIYGAKSANGVVIVTTKKGKEGKPVVRFDTSVGFVTMGANRKVYDADGYLQFRSDYYNSSSNFETPAKFVKPTQENLAKYGVTLDEWKAYDNLSSGNDNLEDIWLQRIGLVNTERENYFAGNTYDWYKNSFQTGIHQDYNASLSGAGKNVTYYWSLGYLNSTGVVKKDEYQAIRSNLKLDANVTSFLDMGINLNFQNRTNADDGSNNVNDRAVDWYLQVTRNSPFALAYDEEGNPLRRPMGESGDNPGWNDAFTRQYQSWDKGSTVFNGTMYAKIKLPFNISYQINYSPPVPGGIATGIMNRHKIRPIHTVAR